MFRSPKKSSPPSSSKSSKVHGPSFHRYAAFLGFQVCDLLSAHQSHRMLSSLLKSSSSLDLCNPTQSSFILLLFYSVSSPVSNSIRINTISIPFYAMLCHVILFSSPSILFWCIDLSACVDYLNIYIYINLYVYPYPSYLFVHLCTYLLVWHWPRDHWMRGLQDDRACTMQDYVDCGLPKKPEFDDHLQMLRGFCQS